MNIFKKKTRILVVEDEKDIADSIKARLELDGYKVTLAGDGKSGVDKARSDKPDLIIMDVMLPLVDGFEATKLIKTNEKTKEIPILILTALPNVEDAEKAFKAGAADFLNKPFTNDRLIQKINKLLKKIS